MFLGQMKLFRPPATRFPRQWSQACRTAEPCVKEFVNANMIPQWFSSPEGSGVPWFLFEKWYVVLAVLHLSVSV